MIMRIISVFMLILGLSLAVRGHAEDVHKATIYKNPECFCCANYASYLRDNGFEVTVVDTHDLTMIKRQAGVPSALEGCHTLAVDGYTVEGHVPVGILKRLLSERPAIRGISLPGMPMGSPGMSGDKTGPLTVYELSDGEPKVYGAE